MPREERSTIGYENRPGLTEFRVQGQDLTLCPYPYERKTRCISRTLSQQTVSHCHFFPSLLTPLSTRLETLERSGWRAFNSGLRAEPNFAGLRPCCTATLWWRRELHPLPSPVLSYPSPVHICPLG